jgi:hypothetical protein
MATIELVYDSENHFDLINIKSGAKSPFPFTLAIHLLKNENEIEVYNVFNGNMNPMLRMMAEPALKNLFNYIAGEVGKVNFGS